MIPQTSKSVKVGAASLVVGAATLMSGYVIGVYASYHRSAEGIIPDPFLPTCVRIDQCWIKSRYVYDAGDPNLTYM